MVCQWKALHVVIKKQCEREEKIVLFKWWIKKNRSRFSLEVLVVPNFRHTKKVLNVLADVTTEGVFLWYRQTFPFSRNPIKLKCFCEGTSCQMCWNFTRTTNDPAPFKHNMKLAVETKTNISPHFNPSDTNCVLYAFGIFIFDFPLALNAKYANSRWSTWLSIEALKLFEMISSNGIFSFPSAHLTMSRTCLCLRFPIESQNIGFFTLDNHFPLITLFDLWFTPPRSSRYHVYSQKSLRSSMETKVEYFML